VSLRDTSYAVRAPPSGIGTATSLALCVPFSSLAAKRLQPPEEPCEVTVPLFRPASRPAFASASAALSVAGAGVGTSGASVELTRYTLPPATPTATSPS
jgi:hypothetical protein